MRIETFIFVHDQQIILDFKKNSKFKEVENLKYVFVSNNPCDKIEDMEDVIIAKKYDDNIEKYNRTLLAYTGWYLLWKNNLITADYINLFEYDIILPSNFSQTIKSIIDTDNFDVIGYIGLSSKHVLFLKTENVSGPLVRSIIKNYNIDPIQIADNLPTRTISVTFNHTLKKETFKNFIEWMEPIINDVKEDRMAGHFPERALPFYYMFNNLNIKLLEGCITHFQMDTHNTQGKPKNFFESNYNYLISK
jgi:hypothetical protein